MKIWNAINFDFKFNIASVDLTSLVGGGTITVPVVVTITNENGFSIPLKNVKAWIYYENTLIAQTSEALTAFSYTVPAHGNLPIIDPSVNLFVNSASLDLVRNIGNHPLVNYTISMTVFGISFSYSDTFTAGS